jgi:hypothetical protein
LYAVGKNDVTSLVFVLQPTAVISSGVNEGDMIGEHPSYHQAITGEEAERRLRRFCGHCFLTRYSEKREKYILSTFKNLKPEPVIRHFAIIKKHGKVHIEGIDNTHDDLQALLTYYQEHRVNQAVKSIGRQCDYREKDYMKSSCVIL